MRIESLEPDIVVFHGGTHQSVATAFLHRGQALLVDALGSTADAQAMRQHLEEVLGVTVRLIVMTHYMSDHMAGLRLFPRAQVVAHRNYMNTFLGQRQRSVGDDAGFVAPTITFTGSLSFDWGRHAIELFHNPGRTLCAIGIDVPGCDLVLCGDAIVGHIAYLSPSSPDLIDEAILRFQRLLRARIVPGHIGVLEGRAFADARHYIGRLRERVAEAANAQAIRAITLAECLAEEVAPCAFEQEWHQRNLDLVLERRIFSPAASPRAPTW